MKFLTGTFIFCALLWATFWGLSSSELPEDFLDSREAVWASAQQQPDAVFLADRANRIRGRIVDPSGDSISGVEVSLFDMTAVEKALRGSLGKWPDVNYEAMVISDERGEFEFSSIPNGPKQITFSHSSYADCGLVEKSHVDGYGIPNESVSLPPRTLAKLKIVDEEGRGVPGKNVWIFPQFWNQRMQEGTTDSEGKISLPQYFNREVGLWVQIGDAKKPIEILPSKGTPSIPEVAASTLHESFLLAVRFEIEGVAYLQSGEMVEGKKIIEWPCLEGIDVSQDNESNPTTVAGGHSDNGIGVSNSFLHLSASDPIVRLNFLMGDNTQSAEDRFEKRDVGSASLRSIRTQRPFQLIIQQGGAKWAWGRSDGFGDFVFSDDWGSFIAWSLDASGRLTYPRGWFGGSAEIRFSTLDERLPGERSIYGFVKDYQGNPANKVEVWAQGPDEKFPRMSLTDEHGFYRFGAVQPGEYVVFARYSGEGLQAMDRHWPRPLPSPDVTNLDTRLDLALFGASLEVRTVCASPVKNLILRSVDSPLPVFGRASPPLEMRITNLKAGQYLLHFSLDNQEKEIKFEVLENAVTELEISNA